VAMLFYGEPLMKIEGIVASFLERRLRYSLAIALSLPIAWFYVGVPQLVAWNSGFGFPFPFSTGSFADFAVWLLAFIALSSILLDIARTKTGRGYVLFAFALGAFVGPYVVIVLGGMVDAILGVVLGPLGLAEAYAVGIFVAIVALIGAFVWLWRQIRPGDSTVLTRTI
jgi:hypothetical protein